MFIYIKKILIPLLLVAGIGWPESSCSKGNGSAAPADTTATKPVTPKDTFALANGVNLQPSYYNSGNVSFGWTLMQANAKIKSVRIEIEPAVPIALAASWIAAAQQHGYQVVATYHKYTVLGSDDASELAAAGTWWKNNYATLAASGAFTINLMNEWGSHNITASAYAAAYNTAIASVRSVYKGFIIIDIPGWGQEAQTAADAVKGTGGAAISDEKIVLSTHIYPGGWNQAKNRWVNSSDIDALLATGRACMVGEFGGSGTGGADWSGMVSYAKQKGCAILAWSWNGDGGDMNMVSPKWADQPGATDFSTSTYFNTVYPLL